MAPTILIIGATGNTGKGVARTLPALLKSSNSRYRILALTRSLDSPSVKELSTIPDIEFKEKDWTTLDTAWLQQEEVERVYIASHNLPHQFVEESALYVVLLNAGVKYVVRVSTNTVSVGPADPVFYGRSHWVIENLLSQPEFADLQWTSLRPNLFNTTFLGPIVGWIRSHRQTGDQETLTMLLAADVPVALIDPEDVGDVGAYLLALQDPTRHNHAKYVLSGPEDITGDDIVKLVERYAGVKVGSTRFKDNGLYYDVVKAGVYPEKLLPSMLAVSDHLWQGNCSLAATPTSKELMQLKAPKRTVEDTLRQLLGL